MKACCPSCGHVDDLFGFIREQDAHQAKSILLRWPSQLADPVMRYLALFEPPQRAMGWKRVTTLLRPLLADVERGYINRRGRDWVAPMDVWKSAFATVIAQRDTLTLPLKDHAYLYEIICRGANRAEAQAESKREDKRRTRLAAPRTRTPYDDPSLGAKPPGGSLTAALANAQRATRSPTTDHTED